MCNWDSLRVVIMIMACMALVLLSAPRGANDSPRPTRRQRPPRAMPKRCDANAMRGSALRGDDVAGAEHHDVATDHGVGGDLNLLPWCRCDPGLLKKGSQCSARNRTWKHSVANWWVKVKRGGSLLGTTKPINGVRG